LQQSKYEQAIEQLQKAKALDDDPARKGRFAWLAYAYAVSGNRDEAQKMLDELKGIAKQRFISPDNFALIYTGLGDRDQAFAWLEKAYDEHDRSLLQLKSSPWFESLRSDPRFTDLLQRIGLAP
jgi:tetratricopeptide (TPR) repeat protein